MPKYVTKYKPFFFAKADEDALCNVLAVTLPSLVYIDGARWKTEMPPVKSTIGDCQSPIVFFWDRSVYHTLPGIKVDTYYQGPTSGVVFQFIRSREHDNILMSGDLGIGYDKDNVKMKYVVDGVWKAISKINKSSLASYDIKTGSIIDRNIRKYAVGAGACSASKQGVLLKHNSVEVYYVCEKTPVIVTRKPMIEE